MGVVPGTAALQGVWGGGTPSVRRRTAGGTGQLDSFNALPRCGGHWAGVALQCIADTFVQWAGLLTDFRPWTWTVLPHNKTDWQGSF